MLGGLAWGRARAAVFMPRRLWRRLPAWLPVESAAFASGNLTLLAGAAVGIPGFLKHAGANVSMANQAVLDDAMRTNAGYDRGMVSGFGALSIFTFLLL